MRNLLKLVILSGILITGCNTTSVTPQPSASTSPSGSPSVQPSVQPSAGSPSPQPSGEVQTVTFAQVKAIIDLRCAECHSPSISSGGKSWDKAENIKANAALINTVVVIQKRMPQRNKTNMTDAERALIGQWFQAGAPVN